MKYGSKIIFDSTIKSNDEIYNKIKDNIKYAKHKNCMIQLWEKSNPYLDSDFPDKLANNEFNQRFWELYLTSSFLNKLSKRKSKAGPDICCLLNEKQKIWIEAILPKEGADKYDMPCEKNIAILIPDDKIVLRYTSSIDAKYKKYENYINEKIISSTDPYIIAINGSKIPFALLEDEIPYFIQAVLPIGNFQTIVEPTTLKVINEGYSHKPFIEKKLGVPPIDTSGFNNNKYKGISGIISSMVTIENVTTKHCLGEDFYFLHNPNAINPIPEGWFKFQKEFRVNNGFLYCDK